MAMRWTATATVDKGTCGESTRYLSSKCQLLALAGPVPWFVIDRIHDSCNWSFHLVGKTLPFVYMGGSECSPEPADSSGLCSTVSGSLKALLIGTTWSVHRESKFGGLSRIHSKGSSPRTSYWRSTSDWMRLQPERICCESLFSTGRWGLPGYRHRDSWLDVNSSRAFFIFLWFGRICFPGGQNAPSGIRGWSRSIGLLGLRDVFRRAPRGWKGFRQVENLYPLAANNAVLGGAPEDPTLRALLEGMVSMPLKEQTVRFALGTHLLQRVVEERGREEGLGLLPPEFFFPIGPEVSQHWFAQSGHSALGEMLHPETRVVHWYASVRTKEVVPLLEPEYILKHREKVPLCALLAPFVES